MRLMALSCMAAMIAGVVMTAIPADSQEIRRVRGIWQGTITARSLNVRAGPGENHDIVGKLTAGEEFEAVDQVGRWVRLNVDEDAWVHRGFVELPEDFMVPAFSAEENAFLEWAGGQPELDEISVDGDGRLSIVLIDESDALVARAAELARDVGCAYREQVAYEDPVTVTVWPRGGPSAGWLEQATCP